MFKIGLGEVPIRQQLTFSIWENLSDMKKFAHQTGSHKDAILKVREGDWFSEELYARFNVIEVKGNFSEFNQKKQELINE
jgi:spheroidene monooxygenase